MNAATNTVEQIAATTTQTKAAVTEDKLLLPREVQERGRFSRWTFGRLVKSGELPVIRHGNLVRVRTSDWEKFLARHTHRGDGHAGAVKN
jgi:hypothetical protein